MLALRCGERALPLAWRVEATEGAIGFEKALLDAVAPWLPALPLPGWRYNERTGTVLNRVQVGFRVASDTVGEFRGLYGG